MSRQSSRVMEKGLKRSIQEILAERFVHSLSNLIYNRVSTIWHLDGSSERELSHIAAKVIIGVFCLEYLSHIDSILKKRLNIKNLTDRNLGRRRLAKGARKKLNGSAEGVELKNLAKEVLPRLKRLVDSIDAETLEKVTQAAHTGDYLISIMEEMRTKSDPEYLLWLAATPHYYEKDLSQLSLLRRPGYIMTEEFPEGHIGGQIPVESLGLSPRGNRINLTSYFTSEEGFFPSLSGGKKNRPYS